MRVRACARVCVRGEIIRETCEFVDKCVAHVYKASDSVNVLYVADSAQKNIPHRSRHET